MVTGQSFVLYSRLHLVLRNPRILRTVLVIIIIDGICLHGPTILMTIGLQTHPHDSRWEDRMSIMERIQLPWFSIQESAISIIYIVNTVKLLRCTYNIKTISIMRQLIIVMAICVVMDAVLIGLENARDHIAQTSIKGLIYAVKLKLEFAVLNQLMNVAHRGLTGNAHRFGSPDAVLPHHNSNHHDSKNNSNSNSNEQDLPNRSVVKDIDPHEFKFSNITGWPRGRLFGRHPRKVSEALSSERTLSESELVEAHHGIEDSPKVNDEPPNSFQGRGKQKEVLEPPPPSLRSHVSSGPGPGSHLPSVSEEMPPGPVVWEARGESRKELMGEVRKDIIGSAR